MAVTADRDIFKEIPYRYLGYANEVGESFRHVVPLKLVYGSYMISSVYVLTHASHIGLKQNCQTPFVSAADTLIWQSLASVVIPGLTINRLCATSKWILQHSKFISPKIRSWSVITIGLSSIPLIVHPIDRIVDKLMDTLIRPILYK